jgi:hypothetical protein
MYCNLRPDKDDNLMVRNMRIFVRNTEEKRHVWNHGHRLEDIIKTDLTGLRVRVYVLDL